MRGPSRLSRLALALAALALLACGGTLAVGFPDCSAECAAEGRCGKEAFGTADGGHRCYVRSSEDCAGAAVCAEEGRCAFAPEVDPFACSEPEAPPTGGCAARWECARFGHCLPEKGRCGPDPARIPDSLACRLKGACTPIGRSRDLAVTPEGCAASLECALTGRCTPERALPFFSPRNCVAPEGPAVADWHCLMRCQPEGACVQGERGQCLREAELPELSR